MSNQQQPPAQKAKAPPPAQRAREKEAARPAGSGQRRRESLQAPADPEQEIAVELEEPVVTAGRNGETNLRVELIYAPFPGTWRSAYLLVHSLPEHKLEGQVEQVYYKKAYSGTGSIQTDVLPGAPIGTSGKLVARDLTTGEIIEQSWSWVAQGGGGLSFFAWLWKTVKKLFAKPGG